MSYQPTFYKVKSPRSIRPELRDRIVRYCLEDTHLRDEFIEAATNLQGRKLVYFAALAMVALKIREQGGNNKGKWVAMIQAVIGKFFRFGDGLAWCMSFNQLALAFAEVMTGKVSKLPATESCASFRRKCPMSHMRDATRSAPGLFWVWVYLTGSRKGLGHTGIFLRWVKPMNLANVLEGNTEKGLVDGKVERDGGGCYMTERCPNPEGMKLAMVADPFPEEAL